MALTQGVRDARSTMEGLYHPIQSVRGAGGRGSVPALARRLGRSGALAGFALLVAATLGATPVAGATPTLPTPIAVGTPIQVQRTPTHWTGGLELYRASAFTSQPNDYTCVPTSVQMMLNLITGASNHSASQITSFYAWGRAHNAYHYSTAGLDPASWAGLLTANGGGTYRDVSYTSYDEALRGAVTAFRATGKPVGLLVDHGHHAWVMSGFTATADPLGSPFRVTGVTIMGPLYPSQSHGYDPRPGTHFTAAQLAGYLTPYTEAFPVRWTGDYVIVAPAS
ncbi:MAG: hypothetical protein ACHQZR_05640 [Candidatus Limnocylindrales bacterium]